MQELKRLKSDEYKQKNPNGLLPAVKIGKEFFYESGAIMQIILERFGNGKLAPAPNTSQRGMSGYTSLCLHMYACTGVHAHCMCTVPL